jgi:hypothetical protein
LATSEVFCPLVCLSAPEAHNMAAIPITFQYTSSRHRYRPSIPSPGPATFPHTRQSLHPRSTQNLTISTTPQFPAQPAIPSPLGSSSTTASTSNTSKRAKSTTPRTLPLDAKVASLKPLLQPILNRCLAFDPTSPTVRSTLGTSKEAMLYGTIRYSRIMDLGNNRSIVPSPREIAREIKLREEKARAKKEKVGLVGKGFQGKGRRGVGGATTSKGRVATGTGRIASTTGVRPRTRSTSPLKEDINTSVPPVTSEATVIPPVTGPFKSVGLKRTRSHGLGLGISTIAANAFGTGAMAVGSPLKAVMGPEVDVEVSEEGDNRMKKRSRSSHSSTEAEKSDHLVVRRVTRRSSSISPQNVVQGLPEESGNSENHKVRRGSGGLAAMGNGGGVGMRRVASAGGIGARSGSAGLDRVKREVILPGRLRDYDIKAGTTVLVSEVTV